MPTLSTQALNQLFRDARTHSAWQDKPVSEAQLREIVELAKMGPTSANCSPARFIFITSPEGKERLKPCLAEGNVQKTMSAPVTVLIGQDMAFYEKLPFLFPHADARSWYAGNDSAIEDAATRNAALQGAYLMLAARAVGLDCGPMSGFDKALADQTFFADTQVKSNFLCNLGYGDAAKLHPRLPRFAFEEFCAMV
jgi:3-hydroxypropanoate dehydrogenase